MTQVAFILFFVLIINCFAFFSYPVIVPELVQVYVNVCYSDL